jgi:hypothetical protein
MGRILTRCLVAAALVLFGAASLAPSAEARGWGHGGGWGWGGGPHWGIGIGVAPWFAAPAYGYYPPPPPPAYSYYPAPAYYAPPAPAYVEPDQQAAAPGYDQSNCQPYHSTVVVGGQRERVSGTACRQPDGTWRLVN